MRGIFGQYTSVNPELLTQVQIRLQQSAIPPQIQSILGAVACPSLFDNAGLYRSAPLPKNADEEVRRLSRAAELIGLDAGGRQRGIREIEELLSNYSDKSNWSASYFGSVAAKASLSDHDLDSARRIIALARRQAPNEAQLLYLTRVIEREGALNMNKIASAKTGGRFSEPAGPGASPEP